VLVDHGIDDVDEWLVTVEQTVATRQGVTFEPTLTGVFAENFHDSARWCQVASIFVVLEVVTHPLLLGNFIDSIELVGLSLIRTEQAESVHVVSHNLGQELGKDVHAWCG